MTRNTLVLLGVSVGLYLGCGSSEAPPKKIDPKTTSQQSGLYAADMVRQLGEAIDLEDFNIGFLGGLAGSANVRPQSLRLPAPLPEPILDTMDETPAIKSFRRPRFLTLFSQEDDFNDTADDVEVLLRDRIFASTNIEVPGDTVITYLLAGNTVCRPLPSEVLSGAPDQVDAECAADVDSLQIRIVVTGDGDGYRYQILLGPEKHELSTFIIHSDLVAWEMGLAEARSAADYANQTLGNEQEPFPFETFKGRVKFAAQKLGEEKVKLSSGVLEPLDIAGNADAPMAFKMGAADPAVAVTGDGVADTLMLEMAMPTLEVWAPWDPMETGASNKDLHVSVGGFYGKASLIEMQEQITLEGVGVGATSVKVRGTQIFGMAFNPQNNNRMDLTVKSLGEDQVRFEVAPRFDLGLTFNLAAIAADFSEPPPEFLQNEVYSIVFADGAPLALETVVENPATGFAGGFRVVGGTLTLSTSANPAATVSVPAGMCLTETEPADGAHPLLGNLTSAACQ